MGTPWPAPGAGKLLLKTGSSQRSSRSSRDEKQGGLLPGQLGSGHFPGRPRSLLQTKTQANSPPTTMQNPPKEMPVPMAQEERQQSGGLIEDRESAEAHR